METIAVLSRKGGAGKTTVSLSLALAAREAGLKVVVADIDPLHSAGEVLRGHPEASSLLVEATAQKLALVQDACLANRCDLLIIDTPPAPEADVAMAVDVADLCLAVARPTLLDVAAVQQTIALLRSRSARALVVLNQCPPARGGVEADLVERALEALRFSGAPLAGVRLRSRLAYQQAFAQHRSVTEWDPSGDAAGDILQLLDQAREQLSSPELGLERIAKLKARTRYAPSGGPVRLMHDFLKRVAPVAAIR